MTLDIERMRAAQKEIAEKVVLRDSFNISEVKAVAGFDVAYGNKKVYCAAAVMDYKSMELIERKVIVRDEDFPYIPTLLMFREGPPVVEAYNALEKKPDVILIDGNGILHPYRAGIATFVGVTLDKPAIGVTKKLLCGFAREGKIYVENEMRGIRMETKIGANPIFISPGHNVAIGTAVHIVAACMRGNHKLPEPLRLAHKFADRAREDAERQPQ